MPRKGHMRTWAEEIDMRDMQNDSIAAADDYSRQIQWSTPILI